jgi:hypothetical protein
MMNDRENGTTRVETSFRNDDYQILARVATARHTSVAALIRRLVYEHIQPLQNAQLEREQRAMAEARERRVMREWTGDDPVRRHQAILDDAIQNPDNH